jgi:hypothetical protein
MGGFISDSQFSTWDGCEVAMPTALGFRSAIDHGQSKSRTESQAAEGETVRILQDRTQILDDILLATKDILG